LHQKVNCLETQLSVEAFNSKKTCLLSVAKVSQTSINSDGCGET